MSLLGEPHQPPHEVEVAPPARALGWIALVCSTPFLLVAVPSLVHHDPFVLAHAARHRVDGGRGHYPAGVLEAISLALNLIWLFFIYVGLSAILTRQFFCDDGVRYRKLLGSRRLPLAAMTSIRLTSFFRPQGADVLRSRTGIELGALTDAPAMPGFQPLVIRGLVGSSALSRMDVRVQLQSGKGAEQAMRYVEQWVRARPELVDDNTRAYFVARGVLAPDS